MAAIAPYISCTYRVAIVDDRQHQFMQWIFLTRSTAYPPLYIRQTTSNSLLTQVMLYREHQEHTHTQWVGQQRWHFNRVFLDGDTDLCYIVFRIYNFISRYRDNNERWFTRNNKAMDAVRHDDNFVDFGWITTASGYGCHGYRALSFVKTICEWKYIHECLMPTAVATINHFFDRYIVAVCNRRSFAICATLF